MLLNSSHGLFSSNKVSPFPLYINLLNPIAPCFKVSAEDQLPSPEPEAGGGGMAGALMKALQDRQKHIQSSGSVFII